jgi:hypothetical protein
MRRVPPPISRVFWCRLLASPRPDILSADTSARPSRGLGSSPNGTRALSAYVYFEDEPGRQIASQVAAPSGLPLCVPPVTAPMQITEY